MQPEEVCLCTYFTIASACLLKGGLLLRHCEVEQLYVKRRKKSTARNLEVTGDFYIFSFFNLLICYFGYVCIAASGVVASLICFAGCQDQ